MAKAEKKAGLLAGMKRKIRSIIPPRKKDALRKAAEKGPASPANYSDGKTANGTSAMQASVQIGPFEYLSENEGGSTLYGEADGNSLCLVGFENEHKHIAEEHWEKAKDESLPYEKQVELFLLAKDEYVKAGMPKEAADMCADAAFLAHPKNRSALYEEAGNLYSKAGEYESAAWAYETAAEGAATKNEKHRLQMLADR